MIERLNEIKQIINEAQAILITAGAGMGVDSGLPDFRGNEGFWNAYPLAKKLTLGFGLSYLVYYKSTYGMGFLWS